MYHYIYKVTLGSKYYIGRHSTDDLNDGYCGSGRWVRQLSESNKLLLKKDILEFCTTIEDLLKIEHEYINRHIHDENCMNFNNSSVGFASGNFNPAKTDNERQRRSVACAGDNNPMKRPEVALRVARANRGKKRKPRLRTESEKNAISVGRTGIKYSEEGRKKLSESRKREYEKGRYLPSFKGQSHSDDTIMKIKQAALTRPKLQCPHCNTLAAPHVYSRFHGDNCKVRKCE